MSEPLEVEVGKLLRERAWMIAVAETTTGGLISARVVSVPGSSAYYERGVIAYSALSKREMLRINVEEMKAYGAVSAEAACAMAKGIREASGADLGLAETGIAGPIRGRSSKPIGTTYIAVANAEGVVCEVFQFEGDRDAIRHAISEAALKMVIEAAKKHND